MTDDIFRLKLDMKRTPLGGLDVSDDRAVREWAKRGVEGRVRMNGLLRQLARFVKDTTEEVAGLDAFLELGEEGRVAAVLRVAGRREGVRRVFREGELKIRDAGGQLRRAAALMELMERGAADADDDWWVAWRFFGEGSAGVGNFHGEWIEHHGTGLEALDEVEPAFREWVDDDRVEVTNSEFWEKPPEASPDFDLRMASLPPVPKRPDHPGELAVGIGRSMDAEVLRQGLTCHLIFLLTEGSLDRFEVRGEPPCTLDDLVRSLVALGPCHGVAMVSPGTFVGPGGETLRAVMTTAEQPGTPLHIRRVRPIRLLPGKPPEPLSEVIQERALREGEGWFGVEPGVELGLHMLGPVGEPAEVPEG